MPENMIGAGDTDALAAEYVLGTLETDERSAAQDLLAKDEGFATKVKVWERRLGELHLMVEPVEPEPDIWQRIKAKLPEVKPATALTLSELEAEVELEPEPKPEPEPRPEPPPEPRPEPTPDPWSKLAPESWPELEAMTGPANIAAESVPPSPDAPAAAPEVIALPAWQPAQAQTQLATPAAADVQSAPSASVKPAVAATDAPAPPFVPVQTARPALTGDQDAKLSIIRRHLARWRAVAVLMTLAVFAVAALLGLWKYEPERVPPVLRPLELMRLVGIKVDTSARLRVPAPPESRFDE
jgi:hypothetical protein